MFAMQIVVGVVLCILFWGNCYMGTGTDKKNILRAGEGSISESEKTCGFFFEGNSYVCGSSGNSGMDCDFGIRKDIDSISFLKEKCWRTF